MQNIIAALVIIASYFLGNISPATILAKASGHDIKREGSGNAGTTNVLRVVGKKAAVITLIVDVLKGFIAAKGSYYIMTITGASAEKALIISAWCGLFVFLGHVFPVFLGFKGGKGVATALGVLIATDWRFSLLALAVFIIVVAITRYVSLGSILAAVVFFIVYVINYKGAIPFFIMVLVLILKHKDNISRLLSGTENKLSFSKKEGKE